MENGIFVMSLDFELFWGVRDKRAIVEYGESIKNVRLVIPRLIDMFNVYETKATFATVGLLFFDNKSDLLNSVPHTKPNYTDEKLSPYIDNFEQLGVDEVNDPYHYASSLIELIKNDGNHEIGSHTYSHYYCLEEGQNIEAFKADMKAAIEVASKASIKIQSIVLPRNQFNHQYKSVLREFGIKTYRGNERIWFHSYQSEDKTTLLKKIFRTANCYFNISGHHCYDIKDLKTDEKPYDIPSSRFLRPYQSKYPFLKYLQLRRIKNSMTYAAKNGLVYHLWWHPHNFGANMEENFKMMEEILEHYKNLKSKYGFNSKTMEGVGESIECDSN